MVHIIKGLRTQGGEGTIIGVFGQEREATFTCGHCNTVHRVPHKCAPEDLGGLCKVCMKIICAKCVGTGRCEPFEEKLKRMEEQDRVRRSYGV